MQNPLNSARYRYPYPIFKTAGLVGLASTLLLSFAPPSLPARDGIHILMNFKGSVQLKRSGWRGYQPAKPGEMLGGNDTLKLASNASATVFCDNLSKWTVKPGEFPVSQGCPDTGKPTLHRPVPLAPTKTPDNPNSPYLISPRHEAIAQTRPTLYWNPVPGVRRYTVTVRRPGFEWQATSKQPNFPYPADKPSLQPGNSYEITITIDGIDRNRYAKASFTLLDDATLERLPRLQQQIENQATPDNKSLLLAHLYRSYGLYTLAIKQLETDLQAGRSSIAHYELLGNLYQLKVLPRLAKDPYQKALQLAMTEKNLDSQATVQVRLGEVDLELGESNAAIQWFKQAQSAYKALGDIDQVQVLQKRIENLQY